MSNSSPPSPLSGAAENGILPTPSSEAQRLQALRAHQILDTPPEAAFDRVVALATRLFAVPMAAISLIDGERQWFKSSVGLDFCETPRSMSFCSETIEKHGVIVVPDAHLDARFAKNGLVVGKPFVRFYAGAPLLDRSGLALGSLCVLDQVPRDLNEDERRTLADLAAVVANELELRRAARQLEEIDASRRATQKALLDSQNRFQSAFEMSANGMALISTQGRFLQVNQRLCAMMGYDEAKFLSLTFQEIAFPAELAGDLAIVAQLVADEIPGYNGEKRFLRSDGTPLWVSISAGVVRNSEGSPDYFVVQMQDISERRQTEERLRLLESVAINANDAILITEAEPVTFPGPRIRYANRAFLEMTGYTLDEIIGQTPRILQGEGTLEESKAKIRVALKKWQPVVVEMLNYKKDGTPFWVELSITPVANEKGWYTHWVSIQRDMGERRQILDALRESEGRYGRIATNVPGMVYQFVLGLDGSFSFPFVSEGCREIYGLEPAQVMANAAVMLAYVHPDDAQSFFDSISESAQTLEPWEWEGRIQVPGHVIKWVRGTSRPKREPGGEIMWDGILFDITGRKKQEELIQGAKLEAEVAREEAERANLAKSEFLSRMSHELRTPLNAILGFGQLLEMSELPAEDIESTEQILKAGRHLLDLINEVLDIARIESGHLSLSSEAVSVREVALETLDLVRPLAAQRGISLHDAAIRNCEVWVRADRQRLKQVLLNLLSNAVKYNSEAGRVVLSCEAHPAERIRIGVRDSGAGIAPELRSRLFTAFDRLGAENSTIEGTGVGLALSRRLAEAMEGTLDLDSGPGQGSLFWIELPRAEDPLGRLELLLAPPTPTVVVNTRLVVLYIEDNPSNLQLVQKLLAHRPEIRLLTAMQGGMGLELARQHCPDLILLDMNLPDMAGAQILEALRFQAETESIPVVIVSADATPKQITRMMEAGAERYLTKPFDVREFLAILDGSLARIGVRREEEAGVR